MIVSKATSVYVIMIVVLVGGLWFILALGSTLLPPTDLAGKWDLTGREGAEELSVEQSGKFINLAKGTWTADLKIEKDGNQSPTGENGIVMSGKGQSVTFEGLGVGDQCTIRFDGPVKGIYQAHRVVKTFH